MTCRSGGCLSVRSWNGDFPANSNQPGTLHNTHPLHNMRTISNYALNTHWLSVNCIIIKVNQLNQRGLICGYEQTRQTAKTFRPCK